MAKEERTIKVRNNMILLMIIAAVNILLWGWLTSIDAVAWLQPFLLQGAVIFAILGIINGAMWDMLRLGFKQ
jgi:hypothetical protein